MFFFGFLQKVLASISSCSFGSGEPFHYGFTFRESPHILVSPPWFMVLNFPSPQWQVREVIPATRNKSTLQQIWGVCVAITQTLRSNPCSEQERGCQLLFSGFNFMSTFPWADCQGRLWTKKEFDWKAKTKIFQKEKEHPFLSFTISVLELSKCVFHLAWVGIQTSCLLFTAHLNI